MTGRRTYFDARNRTQRIVDHEREAIFARELEAAMQRERLARHRSIQKERSWHGYSNSGVASGHTNDSKQALRILQCISSRSSCRTQRMHACCTSECIGHSNHQCFACIAYYALKLNSNELFHRRIQ